MKPSIRAKLDHLTDRLEEIDLLLAAENAAADMGEFRRLSRERAELEPVVAHYGAYRRTLADVAEAETLLADPEMRDFAAEEIAAAKNRLPELELELQKLLLPRDPNDDKSVLLEIRAGTGGDEASLFARDLFEMYRRYAESKDWKVEVLEMHVSEAKGFKEVIVSITGDGAFRALQFESGGHRVQRVPETEQQGRIHTSSATVAVMAEPEDVDIEIRPEDIELEVTRSSGPGGQHVNKTSSAVRLTHIPTGLVVFCQEERSQHKNRAKAMRMIRTRLYDQQVRDQHKKRSETRRSLIGSGDRSERIRTYNFPQNRCTDHRINENWNLQEVVAGNMDKLIGALREFDRNQRLAEAKG